MKKTYKIVTFVPIKDADNVREAMGQAGAGIIGNYDNCTWSCSGEGRFKPNSRAHPTTGKAGILETVTEERIETICEIEKFDAVAEAIRKVHPYEEVPIDVYEIMIG